MGNVILDPLCWESVEAGDEAVLDGWLVSEGDHVHAGQLLGRAKLLHQPVDLRAPHDGIVEQIPARGRAFLAGSRVGARDRFLARIGARYGLIWLKACAPRPLAR